MPTWITNYLITSGSAFLVIDMQNDFLTGSLALRAAPAGQDGLEVLEPLNAFLDEASDNFDKIGLYTVILIYTPTSNQNLDMKKRF